MECVKNFTNIDDKTFVGQYGGDKAKIKAGKTVAMTEINANHLAGQLAAKILIKQGKPWTDQKARAILIAKIFGEGGTGIDKDGTVGKLKVEKAIETPKPEAKTPDVPEDKGPEAPAEEEFPDAPEEEEEEVEELSDEEKLKATPFGDLKAMAIQKGIDMKKIGRSKAKLVRALMG